nr:MAG TPA: hypothetical protein [Caudoviricetes sp.]
MKLKLTMTNAETGEVLHEENDLDFAMMCFGRKTDEGIDFQAVTRGESITAADFAHCLDGVDSAVEKNLRDNKAVCKAYTLVKLGVLGKIVDASAKARPGEGAADAKKEGEQG